MAIIWEPYFLTLLLIDFALCAFIFLITWRIARRFGGRGLAVVVIFAAVIGPPRDYWYLARFPEWGAYGPGVAPSPGAISPPMSSWSSIRRMRLIAGPARIARQRDDRGDAEPLTAADPTRRVAFWDLRLPGGPPAERRRCARWRCGMLKILSIIGYFGMIGGCLVCWLRCIFLILCSRHLLTGGSSSAAVWAR